MGVSAVAAGAGLVGSYMSSNAASDAADAQAGAARDAAALQRQTAQEQMALQKEMYGQQQERLSPYLQAGQNALQQLRTGLQAGGEFNKPFSFDQSQDPSYAWRFNQGQRAMDAAAAQRGGMFTAGQAKALQSFGQDAASQEYNNAFNRYQTDTGNRYSRLNNAVTVGQNSAANIGTAGQNMASMNAQIASGMANNVSGLMGQAANVQAANSMYQANNANALLGQGAGLAMNYMQNRPVASAAPSFAEPTYSPIYGNNIWD